MGMISSMLAVLSLWEVGIFNQRFRGSTIRGGFYLEILSWGPRGGEHGLVWS